MKLPQNCREYAALISSGEDRDLTAAERAAIRVHLLICDGCTAWNKQVSVMHSAMSRWRSGE
jgi:hypothetical protein